MQVKHCVLPALQAGAAQTAKDGGLGTKAELKGANRKFAT